MSSVVSPIHSERREALADFLQHGVRAIEDVLPSEMSEHLNDVAHRVSPLKTPKIVIGEPGQGSYQILETDLVVLDPQMIAVNLSQARFITGHEASHAAISRSMTELGLSEVQQEKYMERIGYGYIHNVLEDTAVNDFMTGPVPEILTDTILFYERQFKKQNAALLTPEVANIARELGFLPRFVEFGSELLRDWHKGDFSDRLDPDVYYALSMVRQKAKEITQRIPAHESLSEESIIEAARYRFIGVHEYIWPDLEKLVKLDFQDERRRQQIKELGGGGQRGSKGNSGTHTGAQGHSEAQGASGPAGSQPSSFSPRLSKEAQNEIQKLRKERQQREKEELKNKLGDLQRKLNAPGDGGANNRDDDKDNKDRTLREIDATLKAAGASEEQIQEIKAAANGEAAELEGAIDALDLQPKDLKPIDPRSLSKETLDELDRAFRALPQEDQESLLRSAKEALSKIESGITRPNRPQTPNSGHQGLKVDPKSFPTVLSDVSAAVAASRDTREKNLPAWELERRASYDKVVRAARAISMQVAKEEDPEIETHLPHGSEIDPLIAMQGERDPRLLRHVYQNRNRHTTWNWAVKVLVDTSPSMSENAEVNFQALVFIVELLEKLKFPSEVSEFSDVPQTPKRWADKLKNSSVKEEMTKLVHSSGGTTRDGTALELAYQSIQGISSKHRMIIVLSDADSLEPDKLRSVIERISRDGNTIIVHFGVGARTSDIRRYYPISHGNLSIGDSDSTSSFYPLFCRSIVDIMRSPRQYLKKMRTHVQNQSTAKSNAGKEKK